jgi:hypothetical protein
MPATVFREAAMAHRRNRTRPELTFQERLKRSTETLVVPHEFPPGVAGVASGSYPGRPRLECASDNLFKRALLAPSICLSRGWVTLVSLLHALERTIQSFARTYLAKLTLNLLNTVGTPRLGIAVVPARYSGPGIIIWYYPN